MIPSFRALTLHHVIHRFGILPGNERKFSFLWSSFFIIGIAWGFTMPLISVVIVEAGVSLQTYGLLQSYAALASMVAQLWIGRFSDRIGRRKPLVIASLLAIAPVIIVFPHVQVVAGFGVLVALHAIAQNAFRATNSAWVSSWAASESLGRMHGTFRIAGSLGWIVATPLLGLLMNRYGSASPFTLAAIIYIGISAFIAFGIPEHSVSRDDRNGKANITEKQNKKNGGIPLHRTLLQHPILFVFFIALGLFHLSQGMGMNLNSIYLVQDLQVSNTQFGWLISFQAWFEVPLMLILGAMSDRFHPSRVLAVGFGLSGLRWLLLSWVTNPFWLYPVQSLHAVGITVAEVLAIAFIARNVENEMLGTAMGWMFAVQNATNLFAPALGGTLAEHHGIPVMFQVSATLALGAGAMMVWSVHKEGRQHSL